MLAAALAMCVLVSGPVAANDSRAAPGHGAVGVRGELGFGTSSGILGAVVWRDLAPALRAEAGVGMGLSGLQLSGVLKVVAGGESHRFVAGAGLSAGIPINGSSIFRDRHDGAEIVMPWLNLDVLGYEYMNASGWTFSLSVGATTPLRRAHWDLVDDFGGDVRPLKTWYPGAHMGFGKAF
jgi:hypothetical protein